MAARDHKPDGPPPIVDTILRWLCAPHLIEEIIGDLHERYYIRVQKVGVRRARSGYWQEVLAYLRPAIIKRPSNSSISNDMLKNYFILALRLFARNKLTTTTNVLGLALALTGSLLVAMFIQDELSYDRYHENADNIYRVTRNFLSSDGSVALHLGHTAPGFGPRLANDFPDIEEVARICHTYITLGTVDENRSFQESLHVENFYYAEPSVFEVFTIPIKAGDTKTALEKPFTMMLSDAAAEKYFGTQDVVGKQLVSQNNYFLITGVYEAFPTQSHWHPDFLVSFSTLNTTLGRERLDTGWGKNVFGTYLLVNDEFDPERVEAQFLHFLDRHMGQSDDPIQPSRWTNLFLQPLTDIHLHSQLDSEEEANGNINHVYIMGAIGVFLLLIAGFNFINLSTARATTRSKEVGLRKAVGALRKQLVLQYLSESTLLAFFAFLLAIVFISLALPWLNEFTDKTIELEQYATPVAILGVVAIIGLVGILAGLYPAFIISRFKPALALKGLSGSTRGSGSGRIRQALVVVQFTISIVMIIATLVTYQQLTFLNDKELGYAKDQVVFLGYTNEIDERFETFYHELTEHPAILNATRSSLVPTTRLTAYSGTYVQQGDSMAITNVVMKDVRIDHHYFDTYQIPIVSGRDFSESIGSDDSTNFIINETAARMVGWTNEEAIGKTIKNGNVTGTVVGVAQDFHFESLHQPIVPVIFHGQHMFQELSVLVSEDNMPEALAHMEAVWQQFVPQQSFDYLFLNEHYQQLYDSEQSQSELFIIFAGLAIFIAAMGLFGLATFSTLQRTKEVSIRKVLGAPVSSILQLLSKEILYLILMANIIAWPIAWYFMREWLSSFAYHIEISLLTFALAGILALIITLITISSQTIKAALTSPATILRND